MPANTTTAPTTRRAAMPFLPGIRAPPKRIGWASARYGVGSSRNTTQCGIRSDELTGDLGEAAPHGPTDGVVVVGREPQLTHGAGERLDLGVVVGSAVDGLG